MFTTKVVNIRDIHGWFDALSSEGATRRVILHVAVVGQDARRVPTQPVCPSCGSLASPSAFPETHEIYLHFTK